MRLVFVADLIPPELERVIEFLNRNMRSVDVVALEVKQFVGGVQTTLVSRLLGQSAATRQAKSVARERREWDEESFFARLTEVCDPQDIEVIRDLFDWLRDHFSRMSWGQGKTEGSAYAVLDHAGANYWAFGLRTTGVVEFPFIGMARRPPFDDPRVRDGLRLRLNEIDGVTLEEVALNKRPSFPIHLLRDPRQRQRFYGAMEWLLETARQAHEALPE